MAEGKIPCRKPHLNLEKQVQKLEKDGMLILSRGEAYALLSAVGYYRLSAYWHPCRQLSEKTQAVISKFKAGATFEDISALYNFDRELKLIVMRGLERFEIAMRKHVGHRLGLYHALAYAKTEFFNPEFTKLRSADPQHSTSRHDRWLKHTRQKSNNTRDEFVKHFREKYSDEHLPIWMATEVLEFGSALRLDEAACFHSQHLRPSCSPVEQEYDGADFMGAHGCGRRHPTHF